MEKNKEISRHAADEFFSLGPKYRTKKRLRELIDNMPRCKQCGSHTCDCKEEWLWKCKCGNDTFWINEVISHEGSIDPETGILECYKIKSNEVESIVCSKCGWEYQSDNFKDIEWNN